MKEIWDNKRYRSMIILGLWMVFIIFIFILAAFGNSRQEPEILDERHNISVGEIINRSIDTKFDFIIKDIEKNQIINGTYNNNSYEGYLEELSGVYKYRCENNVCYKVFMDHEETLDTYLFENDKNPLNIVNVVGELTKYEQTENKMIYGYTDNSDSKVIEYKVVIDIKTRNDQQLNYDLAIVEIIITPKESALENLNSQ